MIDLVADVRLLKDQAKYQKSKADKPNGDAEPAEIIERLRKAEGLLDVAIKQLLPVYKVADDDYKETLSRELADCYGMKGGIYRRWAALDTAHSKAMLRKAAEMYNEGLKYEINDSYNLFNSIVIQVLLEPMSIDKHYPRINECVVVIQEQVKGSRIDQWWAWADLGLCNLLLGKEDDARLAYERFTRTGSRAQDYDSILSVLKNLESAFQGLLVPRLQSISKSIQVVILYLGAKRSA